MSEKIVLEEVEFGVRLGEDSFRRNIFGTVKKLEKIQKRYKNKGVYMTAYQYEEADNKTEDSLLIGDLYIDLDHHGLKERRLQKKAFEEIREDATKAISFLSAIVGVHEDMIRIYFSGQKGVHIMVPSIVLGIRPMKELNHIFQLIAKEIHKMSKFKTIDTAIYDNARLLLVPGTMHPHTGHYKIPLTYQELRTLSFADVKRLAQAPRKVEYKSPLYSTKANRMFRTYIEDWEKEKKMQAERSGKKKKSTLNFCPPCIQSILERPCTEGSRNHTASALSSYFRQRGMSEAKAWEALSDWNSEYAKLSVRELTTTFNSVFHREYVYGCSTLEQLGECSIKDCKIGVNRLKRATTT